MKSRLASTLTVILACLCFSGAIFAQETAATPKTILYVALNGNDAWSGALPAPNPTKTDGPLATLEGARNAIRALKKANKFPSDGISVHLREGVYILKSTFGLVAADAGQENAPVVYRSHPGEKVVLTSGRDITGFTPYKGKILKTDVAAQGLKGIYFRQILFNGKRQKLARYPNFDSSNPHGGGFAYVAGQPLNMYKKLPGGENVRTILCKPADIRRWAHPEIGEVIIFPRFNWNNVCVPIASADPEKGIITLAKNVADPNHPQSRSIRPLDRYYVRNLFEELDAPGEWYLDKETWTLYFWPPAPMENASVRAPALKTLIDIGYKANWITFRGFTMEGCDGTAVKIHDADHCLIANNTIHDTGGKLDYSSAVSIYGGRHCGVVGNDLYEICNNGIRVSTSRKDRAALIASGHYVDNNYLHHIGVLNGHGCGIVLGGVGVRVSHNLIHDTTRCGIFGSGTDCIVEYNHIRHVNLETEDTGGYYGGGRWQIKGMIIRYNYVHDVLGYGRIGDTWTSPHYAWGIYLDDDHSNTRVYGNIVARTTNGGSHIHAGRNNTVENNIFIDHAKRQMQYSGHNRESWVVKRNLEEFKKAMATEPYQKKYPELINADLNTIWHMADNKFRRNIIYYKKPEAKLFQCGVRDDNVFEDNESDYNLVWHCGLPVTIGQWGMKGAPSTMSWEQWQARGFDAHSLAADPLFVDPDKDDYRLQPDSPAFKLGFKPIPVDKIGPYAHPLRVSWPIVEAPGVREVPLVSTKVELPPAPKKPVRKQAKALVPKMTDANKWSAPLPVRRTTKDDPIQTSPCELRVRHDGNNLHVAVSVAIKDAGKLKRKPVWNDNDAAEICLQDISGAKHGPIFVIHGFLDGSHESMTDAGAPAAKAKALGAATQFSARIEDKRWVGQWIVPFKAAGITYKPGLRLAFNVGIRRTETSEWIQWVGSGATWKVAKAGRLTLE